MSQRLIFVRHGETSHNAKGKFIGWRTNPPLTDTGRAQARLVGTRLSRLGIYVIFHSDIGRTTETASIIGNVNAIIPSPTPLLRERDLGMFDDHTLSEVREKWPVEAAKFFDHADTTWKGHGGESLAEVHTRFTTLLESLSVSHSNQSVLLVTHSGYIHTVLRDHFHFFPTESFSEHSHTGITIVEQVAGEYRLIIYNETLYE